MIVGLAVIFELFRFFCREQSEEFRVNHVSDGFEVFFLLSEFISVCVNDEKMAGITADPFLITLVKSCKIINSDGFLIFAASLLDLRYEIRNG